MKARITLIALTAMLLSTTQVMAKDLRTVIFKVEQLCCEKCEAKVKKNIPFEKGVKALKCDSPTKTERVTDENKKTNSEKVQKVCGKGNQEVNTSSAGKM